MEFPDWLPNGTIARLALAGAMALLGGIVACCVFSGLALALAGAGAGAFFPWAIAAPSPPLVQPWSYDSSAGPAFWGRLQPDFSRCELGQRQSPIELCDDRGGDAGGASSAQACTAIAADLPNPSFDYRPSPVQLLHSEQRFQVDYGPGSSLVLGAQRFELLQFHLHSPAEHRLAGQRYPLELHLVHRASAGELAVVGIMVDVGEHNLALEAIWPDRWPDRLPAAVTQFNAAQLLPSELTAYHYGGSLTTPPCGENVQWIVLDHAISFSAVQIQHLQALLGDNHRPLQPLNQRLLLHDLSP